MLRQSLSFDVLTNSCVIPTRLSFPKTWYGKSSVRAGCGKRWLVHGVLRQSLSFDVLTNHVSSAPTIVAENLVR